MPGRDLHELGPFSWAEHQRKLLPLAFLGSAAFRDGGVFQPGALEVGGSHSPWRVTSPMLESIAFGVRASRGCLLSALYTIRVTHVSWKTRIFRSRKAGSRSPRSLPLGSPHECLCLIFSSFLHPHPHATVCVTCTHTSTQARTHVICFPL